MMTLVKLLQLWKALLPNLIGPFDSRMIIVTFESRNDSWSNSIDSKATTVKFTSDFVVWNDFCAKLSEPLVAIDIVFIFDPMKDSCLKTTSSFAMIVK